MSEEKTPIINIFCYSLPYDVSRKIFNEFQNRFRDCKYLVENIEYYTILQKDLKTIELLLALSIFHKRVLANIDSAVKFYGKIIQISDAHTISIGSYQLDNEEKNKMLSLLIHYRNLKKAYGIPDNLFDYYETIEFMRKVRDFKRVTNG